MTVHVDAPHETKGLRDDEIPALVDRVHARMAGHIDDYWRAKGWTG